MSGRRALLFAIFAAAVAGVIAWFWIRPAGEPAGLKTVRSAPAARSTTSPLGTLTNTPPPAAEVPLEGESHLADDLNLPGGTIQRDLEILNELFSTWQSNFPRVGNPVGENAEITAALAGANDLRFAFIRRPHRAINAAGELCDRWGTPFRFHQLSGRQMEIRSAGPDRKFGTDDDAAWTPPQ